MSSRRTADPALDLDDPAVVNVYDELPLWSAMAGLLLLEQVPIARVTSVLDIGCGAGFPGIELAERLGPSSRVYCIDPWRAAIDRARSKAAAWGVDNIELLVGDAADLPFGAETFDLVVGNLVVNNLPDVERALSETFRVCRPGARVALTTNVSGHMADFYAAYDVVLRDLNLDEARARLADHVARRGSARSLRRRLRAAGFVPVRTLRRTQLLRFAGADALFSHHFIRLAFVEGWDEIVPIRMRKRVFDRLRRLLDVRRSNGELRLSVPFIYVEAERP